jgi:hypothetical protein
VCTATPGNGLKLEPASQCPGGFVETKIPGGHLQSPVVLRPLQQVPGDSDALILGLPLRSPVLQRSSRYEHKIKLYCWLVLHTVRYFLQGWTVCRFCLSFHSDALSFPLGFVHLNLPGNLYRKYLCHESKRIACD